MDDGKIFKVDTVPPPPGESDAYSAPTRVGSINGDAWTALIEASHVAEVPAEAVRLPPPARLPAFLPVPSDTVPRLHELEDEHDGDDVAPVEAPAPRIPTAAPPRPSLFPEWVAGTNLYEQAAREEKRARKIRMLTGASIGVGLALAGALWALLR